jgi:asparagine synthase (glutamine-hydrolysing)
MSGLCGWLGVGGGTPADQAAIAAMAARLPATPGSASATRCSLQAALAAVAPAERALFADGDTLWCAISGDFCWSDPSLAALAADQGQGRALADAYRRHGAGCLRHLRGSFALAVVEPQKSAALLAVDRVGIERLTYRATGDGLLFATSIDGLRAHPSFTGALSAQAIFDYLHLSVIPGPDSVYRDVRKLLPGESLEFAGGRATLRSYWQAPPEPEAAPPFADLAQSMVDHLQAAVDRALDGIDGRRVGAFLSGGLDSSTVLGLATRRLGAPVKSFTIGFDTEGFDERSYADIAARHYGSEHHTYNVTPADAAALLDQVATAYDEPFGNSSTVPTFFCARLARDHGVDLMLAGDGGDEVFAGNERYVQQEVFELYSRVPAAARRVLEPALLACPGLPGLRKLQSYVQRARAAMPDRLYTYNFLSGPRLAEVFEPSFLQSVDPDGPMETLRRAYGRAASGSMLRRMLQFDMQVTLADNDLRKVTAMCDLAGVGVRFPFLDQAVVEFGAGVPTALLIRRFRLRDFYKRAMRDLLPPEVIAKRKHGFGMPIRHWIAGDTPVRPAVTDALEGLKSRGIVRAGFLDRLLADGAGQRAGEYGQLAWYLAVLERWLAAHNARP